MEREKLQELIELWLNAKGDDLEEWNQLKKAQQAVAQIKKEREMKVEHIVGEFINFDKRVNMAICDIGDKKEVLGNGTILRGTVEDIKYSTAMDGDNIEYSCLIMWTMEESF